MRIKKTYIEFNSWDLNLIDNYGSLENLINKYLEHADSTNIPFIPTVSQLVDILYSNNTYVQNRKSLDMIYKLTNNIESSYITFIYRGKCYRRPYLKEKIINAPDAYLKSLQRRIYDRILSHIPISECATAYKKGITIYDNAKPHLAQKMILKLDIKDFFGSITFNEVMKRVFNKYNFEKPVGTVLCNLCLYKDSLPKGAPTSPIISNIVMHSFDDMITNYCKTINISYTRYSDDMTFSGEYIPLKLINVVENNLKEIGLRLNHEKTQLLKDGMQKNITGIIVNEKLQKSRKYRKKIRQEIYYCKKFGIRDHIKFIMPNRYIKYNKESNDGLRVFKKRYMKKLYGKINHVLSINPNDKEFLEYKKYIEHLLSDYKYW